MISSQGIHPSGWLAGKAVFESKQKGLKRTVRIRETPLSGKPKKCLLRALPRSLPPDSYLPESLSGYFAQFPRLPKLPYRGFYVLLPPCLSEVAIFLRACPTRERLNGAYAAVRPELIFSCRVFSWSCTGVFTCLSCGRGNPHGALNISKRFPSFLNKCRKDQAWGSLVLACVR